MSETDKNVWERLARYTKCAPDGAQYPVGVLIRSHRYRLLWAQPKKQLIHKEYGDLIVELDNWLTERSA
jgi:hypothetical protein